MKAFVIKNKGGKYYDRESYDFTQYPDFSCCIYDCIKGAQYDIDRFKLYNCEPVEITIVEGDLEQTIRKQICNKIRNYIDKEIWNRFEDQDVDCLTIDLEEFEDLLQEIEQAKESMK